MTLVRNEPRLKFSVVFSVLDLTHMDFNGSVLNQPVTREKGAKYNSKRSENRLSYLNTPNLTEYILGR